MTFDNEWAKIIDDSIIESKRQAMRDWTSKKEYKEIVLSDLKLVNSIITEFCKDFQIASIYKFIEFSDKEVGIPYRELLRIDPDMECLWHCRYFLLDSVDDLIRCIIADHTNDKVEKRKIQQYARP